MSYFWFLVLGVMLIAFLLGSLELFLVAGAAAGVLKAIEWWEAEKE